VLMVLSGNPVGTWQLESQILHDGARPGDTQRRPVRTAFKVS
jgi:hypothetical protein